MLGEARKIGSSGFGQQRRLAVAFHRTIMPDGYSLDLDQFHGLDQIGEEGLKDKVNNHYMQIFGTSIARSYRRRRPDIPGWWHLRWLRFTGLYERNCRVGLAVCHDRSGPVHSDSSNDHHSREINVKVCHFCITLAFSSDAVAAAHIAKYSMFIGVLCGGPGRSPTCDLRVRSALLRLPCSASPCTHIHEWPYKHIIFNTFT